jgi:hypothetical protein
MPLSAEKVVGSIGNPGVVLSAFARQVMGRLSDPLHHDLNSPERVACVLYGLAAAGQSDSDRALRTVLTDETQAAQAAGHARWFTEAGRDLWLPAVELALPTLHELPRDRLDAVLANVDALVAFNGRMSAFEFALTSVLHHALNERRPRRHGAKAELPQLKESLAVLLALFAYAGHTDAEQARKAFDNAAAKAPLEGPWPMTPRERIALSRLDSALERLGSLNPRFKQKLIEACVEAVVTDNSVTITEAELLRAVGARLDVPVPPLFPGPLSD